MNAQVDIAATLGTLPETIIYNDGQVTLATAALPQSSITALLNAGLAHNLGNVVSSDVVKWIRQQIRDAAGDPKLEVSRDEVGAFRAANPDAVAAKQAELFNERIEAIREGKMGGSGVAKPRATPLESIMREIAKKEVIGVLKASGIATPTGDKKAKFAGGLELTMPEMIARRLANPVLGPKIKAAAEKEMAARDRIASKALAEADGDVLNAIG